MKVEIKERRYKPQAVLIVEIPKPNGGIRELGIPTVMNRIIQRAMVQVISPITDKEFLEFSYGFMSGRSCEMAVVVIRILQRRLSMDYRYISDKMSAIHFIGYNWILIRSFVGVK